MNQDTLGPCVLTYDLKRLTSLMGAGTPQMLQADVAPQLLSPSGEDAQHSVITGDDRALYGDLAKLAYGHETHRQIAARVVWLDREQLDFQAVVYAARDRIMHLAVRVADLEAQVAKPTQPTLAESMWKLAPADPTSEMQEAAWGAGIASDHAMPADFPRINAAIYKAMLAAAPLPRTSDAPTFEARHVSLKQRGQRIILTLELNSIEGAPRYIVTPVNPGVVRAPAVPEKA